jgi:signal transduction histidine kinase/DNA-binding response OmpR family regulator
MQELPADKGMDVAILIVDDSAALVESLTYALTSEGYGVESCRDGQRGWKRLVAAAERQASMPDLLLLDLNMPGMDGLTLLRRLRADGRFALLPVIILTGETDTDIRFEALEAGANDYLPKPVQAVELLARVKSIVGWKLAERLQQRRMERLIEAGEVLLSTIDLDRVLYRVMQITTIEMDTEDAAIWLQDTDGSLTCRAAFGRAAAHLTRFRMAPGEGIAGWALKNNQSVLVADAQSDPRFFRKADEELGFRTRDIVSVPLMVRGYSIGVLQAVNKRDGTFSPADLAWMEVLAPMAAAAIASARLVGTLQQRTDELQQRTDELQARNEELDAFAHTVAHDLKAPVTSIVGYATMLEDACTELPEETLRELLHEVSEGANKMSRIIEELLLLAGVRKREIEMGPLDMAPIVREALQRLVGMIEASQAQVVVPRSWPVALGYGPWVEEVWANYISNGLKYGGQPPRLELGATAQSDGQIRFWLRDNGPGLSKEDQARLFVPFTKLDQIRVEGHGLGLSIVRRIIEKLGGEVGVESELGRGSVFSFTLPAAPGGV